MFIQYHNLKNTQASLVAGGDAFFASHSFIDLIFVEVVRGDTDAF